MSALVVNLAVALGVAIALVLLTFMVAVRRGRYDLIDSVWGLGFAVIALVTFVFSAGHGELPPRVVATVLTTVWGVRLSLHIHARNRNKDEDSRYVDILRRAGARLPPGPGHDPPGLSGTVRGSQGQTVSWLGSAAMSVPRKLSGTGYRPSTNRRMAACIASTGAILAAVAMPPELVTLNSANKYVCAAWFPAGAPTSRHPRPTSPRRVPAAPLADRTTAPR